MCWVGGLLEGTIAKCEDTTALVHKHTREHFKNDGGQRRDAEKVIKGAFSPSNVNSVLLQLRIVLKTSLLFHSPGS